jgi:hypothetical protein
LVKYTNEKFIVEIMDVVIAIISCLINLLKDEDQRVQQAAVSSLDECVKHGEWDYEMAELLLIGICS